MSSITVVWTDPSAVATVTISDASGASTAFTVGGVAVTFPYSVEATTKFETAENGTYTLSVKQGGVEILGEQDAEAPIRLDGNGVVVHPDPDKNANAALSATYARLHVIDVTNKGAVGDGVTDDTAAFESALTEANGLSSRANGLGGDGVVVRVPRGDFYLPNGLSTKITVDGVFIVGDASGGSVITGGAGTLFYWGLGDGTAYVKGGGIENIKFRYTTPDATSRIVHADYAGELRFRNIKCAKIGQFLYAGESAARYSNSLRFSQVYGTAYNIGVPVFNLRHGSGFYLTDSELVGDGVTYPTDTTSTHGAATGRNFIQAGTGSWDTIMVAQVISNRFYRGLYLVANPGASVVNTYLSNVVFDYNAYRAIECLGAGGNITKLYATNCYLVATDGHGVEATSSGGLCEQFHFVNCVSIFSGANNWRFTGEVTKVSLDNCHGIGANRLAASNTSTNQDGTVMDVSGWQIRGGAHGGNGQPYNGIVNQARYGIVITAAADRYKLTDATLTGATGPGQFIAHTNASPDRVMRGNTRDDGTKISYATTGSLAAPASGVADSNKTGQTWVLYARGGDVTSVTVNGQVVASASPVQLTINPGDTYSFTYTSTAPTVVRQVLA